MAIPAIVRGTTPTFIFTFTTVDPTSITSAYFTIKQMGKIKVSKPLEEGLVGEQTLEWTITQEESLSLTAGKPCEIRCEYLINAETRGSSKMKLCDVLPAGKEEVI